MATEKDDIYARIDAGIDDFFTSENFKSYLDVMSRFHHYSMRNIILIRQQMPYASRVAGYQTWKSVGRQVMHGERGIRIIRPTARISEVKTDKVDDNGNQIIEKVSIPGFTVCSVFDVSQTEGRELPSPVHELSGDVEEFDRLLDAIKNVSDYTFSMENVGLGDAYGMCDHAIKTIFVKPGLSQAQTLKTSIHELFHSRCHGGDTVLERNIKEIEAEAAAYVVCDHFGLDTSDYSFGYVASWSAGMDHADRKACIRNIHKEVQHIIDELESVLTPERALSNGMTVHEMEQAAVKEASDRLSGTSVDRDSFAAIVYDTKPAEKKEVMMYIANQYYGYRGAAWIRGLTKQEIMTMLNRDRGKFSDFAAYMTSQGCEMDIYEPDDGFEYDLSYSMSEGLVYDLKPERTEAVSVMIAYNGQAGDDVVFSALNDGQDQIAGVKAYMNPVSLVPPAEPYTERLEKYENAGYSAAWPMVSITYSNAADIPAYSMNVHDAVQYIGRVSDEAGNDPSKYMMLRITYTYNDWTYEHVQSLDFGRGKINFLDYLQLAPNVIGHLKSHNSLLEITEKAGKFAPDTTYGREYYDKVLEWAEYCRMELNHNSDSPVISKPPLLDELYGSADREQDFYIDR
ncbi:MAG: ArdC family protein [Wujia sp.]